MLPRSESMPVSSDEAAELRRYFDGKFASVDRRFDAVDKRFDAIEQKLGGVDPLRLV